jgi:CheY-like chemotaxis protein
VRLERVDSHVEMTVSDTGVGIPPEFLPHIFERFRQADSSTTRKYGGLGLGLAIVKHLIELHGGTIEAHSAGHGQGARFVVKLPPIVLQRADDPLTVAHDAAIQGVDLSGLKLLVVDDEVDARELVSLVLGDCGAEVKTAGSAEEALRILKQFAADVLLSDIGMPGVDGIELLRRVRAEGHKMPAIALTAFARTVDRRRIIGAGFLIHVAKPIEPFALAATVATAAGRTSSF